MSLHNLAFHWLADVFMQLPAAGCRGNILNFHCPFQGKILLAHLNEGNLIQNLHLERYTVRYTVGNYVSRLC